MLTRQLVKSFATSHANNLSFAGNVLSFNKVDLPASPCTVHLVSDWFIALHSLVRAGPLGATLSPVLRAPGGGQCARRVGRDGSPVGSCAIERQYRDRQSSWWPAYHGEGENMADDLGWFVGVDSASETHQVPWRKRRPASKPRRLRRRRRPRKPSLPRSYFKQKSAPLLRLTGHGTIDHVNMLT